MIEKKSTPGTQVALLDSFNSTKVKRFRGAPSAQGCRWWGRPLWPAWCVRAKCPSLRIRSVGHLEETSKPESSPERHRPNPGFVGLWLYIHIYIYIYIFVVCHFFLLAPKAPKENVGYPEPPCIFSNLQGLIWFSLRKPPLKPPPRPKPPKPRQSQVGLWGGLGSHQPFARSRGAAAGGSVAGRRRRGGAGAAVRRLAPKTPAWLCAKCTYPFQG